MKKLFIYLFLSIFLISLVSAVPKIQPYVNDFANILSEQEETNLNLLADQIEKNTTYEVAIVTVQNTEGLDPIEFANRIGDENGVGKKDKDNGMVVLVSLETRKVVIATGRYTESIINDAKAGRIIDKAVPSFKDGKYAEGFTIMLNEINSEILNKGLDTSAPISPAVVKQEEEQDNFSLWYMFLPMIIILFFWLIRALSDDGDTVIYSDSDDKDKPDKSVYKYKKVKGKRNPVYLYGAVASTVLASRSSPPSSHSSSSSSSSSSYSSGGFRGGGFSGGGFGGGGCARGF